MTNGRCSSAVVVVLIAVALLLGACGGSPSPGAGATGTAKSKIAGGAYPVRIDNCGQTLTIDAAPQRVVTFYQPTVELMIALGLEHKLIGKGGFNESPLLPEQAAAFKRIPTLYGKDGTSFAPPKEVLFNARPDLVLQNDWLDSGYSLDAANGFATAKQIRDADINLYTFTARCKQAKPGTYTDIYTDLRNIAKIFGVPERAEPVIAKMQATIKQATNKVGGLDRVPVVFYDTDAKGTKDTVYGNGEFGDPLAVAGAKNLFDDVTGYKDTSVEAITRRKPEIWLVLSYGGGMSDADKRKRILERFPDAPASKNGRFVFVQNIETTTSIRVADTILTLAKALHPDAF